MKRAKIKGNSMDKEKDTYFFLYFN